MLKLGRRNRIAIAALTLGGTTLVLEGCDPAARDQILGGVEGGTNALISSIISAFFATIQARADEQDTATTVIAPLHETVVSEWMFA